MFQTRGKLSLEPLFTNNEIGLRNDASLDLVMKVFLNIGEATASRWIEMPQGILVLQSVPDSPASGAIYLYDRQNHAFYYVLFGQSHDDTLTTAEFEQLVTEYDLVSWAAHPALLRTTIGAPAMA